MKRLGVIVAFVLGACTSTSGLSNGGGDPPIADGGAEASAPSDAATTRDASPGEGPNLLTNGDFELGCAGWDTSFAFISEANEAHGGKKSCKVCMDTNWEAFFEQQITMAVEANHTYYAEAWLAPATSVQSLADAGFVESSLRVSAPGAKNDYTLAPTFDAAGGWVHATAIFEPTLPANELTLEVRLQQTGNPADRGNVICVYVDDVVVRRLD